MPELVLDDETTEKIFKPLDPENLPDVTKLTETIREILEYMCSDTLIEMKKTNLDQYKNVLKMRYETFENKYPTMFNMIIEGKEISTLLEMFIKIEQIKNGTTTMKLAEEELGEKLADKYDVTLASVYRVLSNKTYKEVAARMSGEAQINVEHNV